MRLRITLEGHVQGFGFRPTVYRLAQTLRVTGWVRNANGGLEIEVEGAPEQVDHFLTQLTVQRPTEALVSSEVVLRIHCLGTGWFEILPDDNRASRPEDEITQMRKASRRQPRAILP
jgi:hydrogenase maturation protein HypF